jgi:hypothetical protein
MVIKERNLKKIIIKTRKNISKKRRKDKVRVKKTLKKTFTKKDYDNDQGMLTSVWGPAIWHYLHTLSFNYPVKPTINDKKCYRAFILNLKHTLPCKYCRDNFKNNLKMMPLKCNDLKNRTSFSRWMFKMHELINIMLGKKSGLKYCDIRDRYENFRSRCTIDKKRTNVKKMNSFLKKTRQNKKNKKESGCTEALYGKPSKCIVKIIPLNNRIKSFQMDKKCIKKR